MKYQATAEVVGSLWRVTVPDIGHVDTEYLLRVEFEARTLIADRVGAGPDSFEVEVTYGDSPESWIDPDGMKFVKIARRSTGGSRGVSIGYVPIGRSHD